MKQRLATGIDSFEGLRKEQYFFIDKTYFIKEWWEQGDKVTLITRPRRFGKTMNMSMLECFFSTKYAGRDDLFDGLAVWEDEKYRELQGTYPVINLSFADVKCADYIGACKVICQNITKVFKVYSDIIDNDKLGDKDKVFLEQVNIDMPDYIAIQSLQELSAVLQAFYGEKVIILLDEYDTPLIEAYTHGYWQEMTAKEYVDSLRKLNTRVYMFGKRVENFVDHPIIRPSINSIAMTYALAQQDL